MTMWAGGGAPRRAAMMARTVPFLAHGPQSRRFRSSIRAVRGSKCWRGANGEILIHRKIQDHDFTCNRMVA